MLHYFFFERAVMPIDTPLGLRTFQPVCNHVKICGYLLRSFLGDSLDCGMEVENMKLIGA
jgi:hypothetical protein